MKKIIDSKGIKFSIVLFLFFFFLLKSGVSHAREDRDMILVLDTSLSMVGYGGKNILSRVKKSLKKFVDQLEDGDSITFVTFDTSVKVYPIVYTKDDNDRDIIKKYLTMVEARGKWTYTMKMVNRVLKEAQELEDKEKDRQRIIVILTDALDDPPPYKRKHRLNIKDVAGSYQGKDWFIYFIDLGEFKKNKRMMEIQQELKKSVTEYTKIIDAKKSLEKGIEEDLKEDVEEMIIRKKEKEKDRERERVIKEKEREGEKERKRDTRFAITPLLIPLLIIILGIAIVLLLIFLLKSLFRIKVMGKLDYWDHTVIEPYIGTFNMTNFNTREIRVGRSSECQLNIRDIEITEPFTIKAVRDQGEIKHALVGGADFNIEYVNRDAGNFLANGDMFKVSNYTFKYIAD